MSENFKIIYDILKIADEGMDLKNGGYTKYVEYVNTGSLRVSRVIRIMCEGGLIEVDNIYEELTLTFKGLEYLEKLKR